MKTVKLGNHTITLDPPELLEPVDPRLRTAIAADFEKFQRELLRQLEASFYGETATVAKEEEPLSAEKMMADVRRYLSDGASDCVLDPARPTRWFRNGLFNIDVS